MLIDCAVSKVGLPPVHPLSSQTFHSAQPAREQLTFTTDPDWRSPQHHVTCQSAYTCHQQLICYYYIVIKWTSVHVLQTNSRNQMPGGGRSLSGQALYYEPVSMFLNIYLVVISLIWFTWLHLSLFVTVLNGVRWICSFSYSSPLFRTEVFLSFKFLFTEVMDLVTWCPLLRLR